MVTAALCAAPASAGERDIIKLSEWYLQNGEYYSAVTETMRYQYNYPAGRYYPQSLIIMGRAYYRGDNYYRAVNAFKTCYDEFKDTDQGQEALLRLGTIRLLNGSPYFALRSFQEYQYIYREGRYAEDVLARIGFSLALMDDLDGALENIESYTSGYPEGKYIDQVKNLRELIDAEINRPRKNIWVSVAGSIFIPGFGHFYTGRYSAGFLSFFSNAALICLFYDALRDNDKFRMLVFGIGEMAFYQYSLYSAISNVHRYNSGENFRKSVKLGISTNF